MLDLRIADLIKFALSWNSWKSVWLAGWTVATLADQWVYHHVVLISIATPISCFLSRYSAVEATLFGTNHLSFASGVDSAKKISKASPLPLYFHQPWHSSLTVLFCCCCCRFLSKYFMWAITLYDLNTKGSNNLTKGSNPNISDTWGLWNSESIWNNSRTLHCPC